MRKLSMHSPPLRYHGKSSGLVFIRSAIAQKNAYAGNLPPPPKRDGQHPVSAHNTPRSYRLLTWTLVAQVVRGERCPRHRSEQLSTSRLVRRARGPVLHPHQLPVPPSARADVQEIGSNGGAPPQRRLWRDGPAGVRDRIAVHARLARASPRLQPPPFRRVEVVPARCRLAKAVVRPRQDLRSPDTRCTCRCTFSNDRDLTTFL